MNKKRWIVRLFVILLVVLGIYFEMSAWAPYRVQVRTVQLESQELPSSFDNVSMGVVSDIYGNTENLVKAKKHYDRMNPEFLIFTGNLFVETPEEEVLLRMRELLSQFKAPMGKFAILSPNDNETTRQLLVDAGFTIVSNKSFRLYNGTEESIMINFYDSLTPTNFTKDEGVYSIGFAYDANTFDLIKGDNLNTFVGSKTQGGGINLPFLGSISYDGITKKSQYMDATLVLVNQGIGTPEPQVRLLSNPELLILNFKVLSNEP